MTHIAPIPPHIPSPGRSASARAHAEHRSFNAFLRQADFSPPGPPEMKSATNQAATARDAAKQLIASAFLIPMLASLRENSFAAGPWAPTTAERRFGPVIDQQIADQVMSGTNFDLIDSIVNRFA